MNDELVQLLRNAATSLKCTTSGVEMLTGNRCQTDYELAEKLFSAAASLQAQQPSLFVKVGNLPTMNQDEYPGLGDWWVQLRTGEGNGEVFARVYGDSPDKARERACIVRDALGRPPTSAVPDVIELARVQHETLEWYGEQTRLCRLIHAEGDAGREALSADGGAKAQAALAKYNEMMGEGNEQ